MATFTVDWHTQPQQRWKHLADLASRPIHALEIGVHEGRSTCWLLDHVLTHPAARLWTVDPFDFQGGDSEEQAELEAFKPATPPTVRKTFFANVAPYGDRVRHFELFSDEFFRQNLRQRFDLVLIDGGHSGSQACRDLLHAWQRLNVGGRLVFDDYRWRGDQGFASDGPRRAMDAFLLVMPPADVRVVFRGYIVILEKLQ